MCVSALVFILNLKKEISHVKRCSFYIIQCRLHTTICPWNTLRRFTVVKGWTYWLCGWLSHGKSDNIVFKYCACIIFTDETCLKKTYIKPYKQFPGKIFKHYYVENEQNGSSIFSAYFVSIWKFLGFGINIWFFILHWISKHP